MGTIVTLRAIGLASHLQDQYRPRAELPTTSMPSAMALAAKSRLIAHPLQRDGDGTDHELGLLRGGVDFIVDDTVDEVIR